MEYIGFMLLMIGAAGMDGNTIVAGVMMLVGVLILAVKGRGHND